MDTIVIGGEFRPANCVKKEGEKVPILFGILLGMQSFFIDRTSGDVAVQAIIDKQVAVEKDSRNPPIIIWPEGTQSNGKYLIPFKRGAFESLKAVTPVTTSFKSYGMVEYSWDCLGFFEQGVATFAGSFTTNTTTILPPLKPTEYMFDKFADKGKSKAEIFAWVTRDIMSK